MNVGRKHAFRSSKTATECLVLVCCEIPARKRQKTDAIIKPVCRNIGHFHDQSHRRVVDQDSHDPARLCGRGAERIAAKLSVKRPAVRGAKALVGWHSARMRGEHFSSADALVAALHMIFQSLA